jgi:hypothetical protein
LPAKGAGDNVRALVYVYSGDAEFRISEPIIVLAAQRLEQLQ